MKYIRHREKGFFLFPESMIHKDLAVLVCAMPSVDIVSAGFIEVRDGRPVCYGKSISLDVAVGATDTQDLRYQIGEMI